jgi:hypothetical protein
MSEAKLAGNSRDDRLVASVRVNPRKSLAVPAHSTGETAEGEKRARESRVDGSASSRSWLGSIAGAVRRRSSIPAGFRVDAELGAFGLA